ncbi:N-terminal acetyltransferase A complex auxiliary subunit NAA15, partial [Cucurbita argyrosperma subsp. sororia]
MLRSLACTEKEPPSTLMWILFLLAQHYDRRGQYDIALSKIDEAIKHTPTVIDLYSVKSRILKHAGDAAASAALADEARCMDLADRYINSDCVKRMLQADQEADVKNEETNNSGVSKSGKRHVKPVDTDPHGEKLVQVKEPLLEATKYLKLLQKHSPDSLDTHVLSFEVNMRKQKILLAFQAVKQLLRLDAETPGFTSLFGMLYIMLLVGTLSFHMSFGISSPSRCILLNNDTETQRRLFSLCTLARSYSDFILKAFGWHTAILYDI